MCIAFFRTIGAAFKTAGLALASAVQLGFNPKTNRAVGRAADETAKNGTEVCLDFAGFVVNGIAPTIQATGHAIAVCAIQASNVVTARKIKELSSARRHQQRQMHAKVDQARGGIARLLGKNNSSFNSSPGNQENWMGKFKDSTKITDIFLPGTHNSVAQMGGDMAQCQSWSIKEQLQSGIRCFDLRFRRVGNNLRGHHGPIDMRISFGGVADQLEEFLKCYPTEVIFLRIKEEHTPDSKRDFKEILDEKMLQRGSDCFMWENFGDLDYNSEVGKFRGHIVAFQGYGANILIDKQDKFRTGDADQKWNDIYKHATKTRIPCKLYINYLSGTGADGMTFCTPSGMAFTINGKTLSYVHNFKPSVYIMDYPGSGLVENLIMKNF